LTFNVKKNLPSDTQLEIIEFLLAHDINVRRALVKGIIGATDKEIFP
jgi:hypothetical protein